jgi:hypothetical protein
MDASQRWETEALHTGSRYRKSPPQPSAKQQPMDSESPTPVELDSPDPDANWVTLREAEAETSVPLNTLRKWCRKSAIPSYLESDGELTLRMVDLDAVLEHAHDLGRETTPAPDPEPSHQAGDDEDATNDPPTPPEGTLIVPLDAWNKMLNQLGNLHDAGQQLAEARERAAKAETESTFLRERLAELRAESTEHRAQAEKPDVSELSEEAITGDPSDSPPLNEDGRGTPETMQGDEPTTSYWRYLTFGWRDRKKRDSKKPS